MPRSSDNWDNDKSTSDSGGFGYSHSSNGGGDAWRDAGERSYGDIPPEYGYQPNANYEQPGSGNSAPKDANYDVTETTEFQPSPPGASAAQQGQYGQTYGQTQNGAQEYGQGYAQGYGASQQGQYQQPNQYSTQYGHDQQYGQGQQYGQQHYPDSAAYGSPAGSASVGETSGSSGFPLAKVLALIAAVVALVAVVGLFFLGREQGWFDTSNNEAGSSQSRDAGQDTTAGQNDSNSNDGQTSGRDTSNGGDDSSGRPQYPDLPSGVVPANNSAENNEAAGNLNNVYVLGGHTTKPFARNVRDAFVRNYLSTRELNTTLKGVYSPETGRAYDMECVDNGQYVRCDGGSNAIVIID